MTPERAIADSELGALFSRLERYDHLLLAVSGGADSVALMRLVAAWARGLAKPRLMVATVDHGLRAGSAEEAAWVGRQAAALGVAHTILRWDGPKPATGVQEAARRARYDLLLARARTLGPRAAIVTGHHRDDQVETFLMRLARGSGLDGLAGMSASGTLERFPTTSRGARRNSPPPCGEGLGVGGITDVGIPPLPNPPPQGGGGPRCSGSVQPEHALTFGGPSVERPFLGVAKARLVATLEGRGQPWLEDPSNTDATFERARLRAALPVLGKLGLREEAIALSARRLGRAREALDAATDQLMRSAVDLHGGSWATIDSQAFDEAPEELRVRLLARLLAACGGQEEPPRLSKVERLVHDLTRQRSTTRTLGGCIIKRKITTIEIRRERSRRTQRAPLDRAR